MLEMSLYKEQNRAHNLPNQQEMKTYSGVKVQFHTVLASPLDGGH